jgi:hypothetical protein
LKEIYARYSEPSVFPFLLQFSFPFFLNTEHVPYRDHTLAPCLVSQQVHHHLTIDPEKWIHQLRLYKYQQGSQSDSAPWNAGSPVNTFL